MSFTSRTDSDILNQVTEEYRAAASWLPFTALELKAVFSPAELAEAQAFIDDVKQATSETDKVTRIQKGILKYGKVVFKLLKTAKVVA